MKRWKKILLWLGKRIDKLIKEWREAGAEVKAGVGM